MATKSLSLTSITIMMMMMMIVAVMMVPFHCRIGLPSLARLKYPRLFRPNVSIV